MSPPSIPAAVTAPPRNSKLAVWSLVLGILALCTVLPAIPAIILGIIALVKINNSGGALGGKGMAIGGLIASALTFVLLPIVGILASIAIPAFTGAQREAKLRVGEVQAQGLYFAVIQYAGDHGDRIPENWEATAEYMDLNTFDGSNALKTLDNYRLMTPGAKHGELAPDEVIIRFDFPPPDIGSVEVSADGSTRRIRSSRR